MRGRARSRRGHKSDTRAAHRRAQRLARDLGDATGLDDEAIQALRQSLEQLSHSLERGAISVERQERLVQDLLDVSRITAGKITYRMAPQDLAALVRDATEEQRLIAPQRIIQLELPEQPIAVTADADRITQVVGNYLTNALKYSPSDQPVSVSVRPHGDIAQVIVRDSGPGLTSEQQQRLFEQFYRADGIEVLSGSGVGLGLGLYISKAIVESHGGQVGVESAPGAGSAFWFTLPIADPQTLAPDAATE